MCDANLMRIASEFLRRANFERLVQTNAGPDSSVRPAASQVARVIRRQAGSAFFERRTKRQWQRSFSQRTWLDEHVDRFRRGDEGLVAGDTEIRDQSE